MEILKGLRLFQLNFGRIKIWLNQKGGSMSKILGTIDLRYKAANVIMIYE
jgi:hypothetical protein